MTVPGRRPPHPLSTKSVPMETVKKIKEELYDDNTWKRVKELTAELPVSIGFIQKIRTGEIHPTVEPILSTQKG